MKSIHTTGRMASQTHVNLLVRRGWLGARMATQRAVKPRDSCCLSFVLVFLSLCIGFLPEKCHFRFANSVESSMCPVPIKAKREKPVYEIRGDYRLVCIFPARHATRCKTW